VLDWAIQAHGGGGMVGDFPLAYIVRACARTLRFATGPTKCTATRSPSLELSKHVAAPKR